MRSLQLQNLHADSQRQGRNQSSKTHICCCGHQEDYLMCTPRWNLSIQGDSDSLWLTGPKFKIRTQWSVTKRGYLVPCMQRRTQATLLVSHAIPSCLFMRPESRATEKFFIPSVPCHHLTNRMTCPHRSKLHKMGPYLHLF